MPPHYKLSPVFIAMLLDNKRKASPPDPPLSDDNVRQPAPEFTPLEEILGERRAPGSAQALAKPEPQRTLPTIGGAFRPVESSAMAGSREAQITPLEEILGE